MSYSSPRSEGPGGNGQWYDDHGDSAYYEQSSSRHQQPARQRPSQQHQQYYQHPQQHRPDPRMRFPRPQANPRVQPSDQQYDMYDGSDYGDQEHDQWPLSPQRQSESPRQSPSRADRPHPAGARRGPPPRPQRPDYVPPGFEPQRQTPRSASAGQQYQRPPNQHHQATRSASADHYSDYQQPVSQQSYHGTGQWTGDGYSYNTPPSSSHGQPITQHATYNKNVPPRPPLGPPPSSRRGPSYYYSQQLSPVHPIVEEAERSSLTREISREGESGWGSQGGSSMTSSNAIPIGIPKFYLDGRESGVSDIYSTYAHDVEDSDPRREESFKLPKQRKQQPYSDNGHGNVSSQQQIAADRDEARGFFPPVDTQRNESPSDANVPVRQASLGKRSKPTLTTVKSSDRMRSRNSASKEASASLASQQNRAVEKQDIFKRSESDARPGADRSASSHTTADRSLNAPPPVVHATGMTGSDASFFDSSSGSTRGSRPVATTDSPRSSIRIVHSKEQLTAPEPTHQTRGRSPLTRTSEDDDYDAQYKEMLGDPEKVDHGELIREDSDTLKSPTTGLAGQRVGQRRPPRLDVDAIRDQEARGSLSSLSDLIKRATKLASNLDRGRTASRLGMEGWLGAANGNGHGKTNSSGELEKYRRSAGSLSDILASFPPPGVPTPTGQESRGLSRRQSAPLRSDSNGGSRVRSRKPRRCCGIPLWLFLTVLVLLVGLAVAAALIPVVLIVLPGQKDSSATSASQLQTTGTQADNLSKCARKLSCENGGQAFPSSADDANTCKCLCVNSFTGPTCSTKSTAGCSSITIEGMQQDATIGNAIPRLISLAETDYNIPLKARSLLGLFNDANLDCAAENALVSFDGKAQKRKHRRFAAPQASQTASAAPSEATTNGIVFDSSPSPTQASGDSSPTPIASASASPTTNLDVDFARAAVLYILQSSSSLQDAEGAQKALQESLDGHQGSIVEVGNWTVDLGAKTVKEQQ